MEEEAEPDPRRHRYISINQAEPTRNGPVWMALGGPGKVLKIFHGDDAQKTARAWVIEKFDAHPAAEVVLLARENGEAPKWPDK